MPTAPSPAAIISQAASVVAVAVVAQLQFPVVYLLIGAEGLVVHPVCGVDVRVRGDGLFEGGDRLRVVPGDLLLIPSTVKHKVALGADDE